MTLINAVLAEEIADLRREAGMLTAARDRYDREIADLQASELNKVTLAAVCESVYSGAERVLLMIATELDGSPITKSDSWHRDLIDRMRNPFGSRPPVLSPISAGLMNELRGFRHKVRSHYGSMMIGDRVRELSFQAEALANALASDLEALTSPTNT